MGGMVLDEIDSCITAFLNRLRILLLRIYQIKVSISRSEHEYNCVLNCPITLSKD